MSTANRARAILGIVTGLAFVTLALIGAEGLVWVIPALIAGAVYSIMGVLSRPETSTRDRNRNRHR